MGSPLGSVPGVGGMAGTTTDEQGHFQLNVAPGTYLLAVQHYSAPTGVPSSYFYYYSAAFDVGGATTYDIDLPVAKIQGTLSDESSAPVAGAGVTAYGQSHSAW